MTDTLRGEPVETVATAGADQTVERAAPATSRFAALARLQTFRSLRHRDFSLLWIGNFFSGCGQWLQQATLGWVTYDLTGSAFLLGAVNGFRSVPMLLLGPVAGVTADRVDRKRLILTTQIAQAVLSVIFATVIVSGHLEVWHVFAMTFLSGVFWTFGMPVRHSIVPALVPREDLMNALALNSAGFSFSRIFGPTLAGLLIAWVGPGENFYLQALAYFAVSWMSFIAAIPRHSEHPAEGSVGANIKEGVVFIWRHPTLRTQMVLALAPIVIGFPFSALLPIFATNILNVGPEGYGLMMAAPGLGAVIGTLGIASVNVQRKGLLVLGTVFIFGTFIVIFGQTQSFLLSLLLLVVIGAVQMMYMATNQTMVQLATPEGMRGRVMGVYMLNQGLLPLGSLFAGTLATFFGAQTAVSILGGLVALIAVAFFFGAPTLRRA